MRQQHPWSLIGIALACGPAKASRWKDRQRLVLQSTAHVQENVIYFQAIKLILSTRDVACLPVSEACNLKCKCNPKMLEN